MPTSSKEILRIEAFYHIAIWLVKKNFHVPQFFHTFPLLGGEEKGEGGNWGAAQRSII